MSEKVEAFSPTSIAMDSAVIESGGMQLVANVTATVTTLPNEEVVSVVLKYTKADGTSGEEDSTANSGVHTWTGVFEGLFSSGDVVSFTVEVEYELKISGLKAAASVARAAP